jgi:hypothetical protein
MLNAERATPNTKGTIKAEFVFAFSLERLALSRIKESRTQNLVLRTLEFILCL